MSKRLLGLILMTLAISKSFSQAFDTEGICDKVIQIDTVEYKSNFVKSSSLEPTNRFVKTDGQLTISTKRSVYTFTDNHEHGDYDPLYKVAGENANKNWIWIEEQRLHTARYFLINTKTSHIDTLVGAPKIFGNKIVCLEDGYTDSPRKVEIYKIKNDRIVPIKKIQLMPCDKICCVRTICLKGKILYFAENDFKHWRAWKARLL